MEKSSPSIYRDVHDLCNCLCWALKLQNISDFYLAIFLFLMNNVGGNLPVIVAPIADLYDLRFALYIIWAGFVAASKYTYIFFRPLTRLHFLVKLGNLGPNKKAYTAERLT